MVLVFDSPEKDWDMNVGFDGVLTVLQEVKDQFGEELTWADLIVLAGNVAIERVTGEKLSFCPGRSDATEGSGSESLKPWKYPDPTTAFRQKQDLLGLTRREFAALSGRMRSGARQNVLGYSGSYETGDVSLTGDYYNIILNNYDWKATSVAGEFESGDGVFMLDSDLVLKYETDLQAIAQDFASDDSQFLTEFVAAWTKLMNSDRFDGPVHNACDARSAKI